MCSLETNEVAKKYNDLKEIWNNDDKWHIYTKKEIKSFIIKHNQLLAANKKLLLNAGSAGYSYELDETNILHLDIADKKIIHLKNGRVGSVENIPFNSNYFDSIICVGSVINYCDPIQVFSEFARVLNKDGILLLEFENSKTFEFIFTKRYNRKAILEKTFYNGKEEILWFYSEKFIKTLAKEFDFKLIDLKRFHLLTPLIYRFFKSENFAAKFSCIDKIMRYLPIINKISSNVILLLCKI